MKKILVFGLVALFGLGLSGCSDLGINLGPTNDTENLTSEEAISSLAYLSASMLDTTESTITASLGSTWFLEEGVTTPETEVENELDDINVYIDKLKSFIDNGPDQFGSINSGASDRAEYQFMINVSVEADAYVIYYNVDELTGEIDGIFVIGDLEYQIEVQNALKDKGELEDPEVDNEEEQEVENEEEQEVENEVDDENEQKMVLVATNGVDTIKVTYKVETEEDESTTKFFMEKDINGEESEVSIKISQEDNEYKIDIEDGENSYTFKRELEEEGTVYKLNYEVNGVSGSIKIIVTIDELGNEVYTYQIKEGSHSVNLDLNEPKSHGDHDDDDENEESEVEEETEGNEA